MSNNQLTRRGNELEALSAAGSPLPAFSHIGLGFSNPATTREDTTIRNELFRGAISSSGTTVDPITNEVLAFFDVVVTAEGQGFNYDEVGLYTEDGELFAFSRYQNQRRIDAADAQGVDSTEIRYHLLYSDLDAIVVNLTSGAGLTLEAINQQRPYMTDAQAADPLREESIMRGRQIHNLVASNRAAAVTAANQNTATREAAIRADFPSPTPVPGFATQTQFNNTGQNGVIPQVSQIHERIATAEAAARNAANLTSGVVNDARLPDTISSSITGNAATATNAAALGGVGPANYARTDIAENFDSQVNVAGTIFGNIIAATGGNVQSRALGSGNATFDLRDETGALRGFYSWFRSDNSLRFRNAGAGADFDLIGNSIGGWSIGSNAIWHAGNDGANSGLDADLLDGLQASAFALAATTITAGNGLSGGGSLQANRSLDLAFNELPVITTLPDDGGFVVNNAPTNNAPARISTASLRGILAPGINDVGSRLLVSFTSAAPAVGSTVAASTLLLLALGSPSSSTTEQQTPQTSGLGGLTGTWRVLSAFYLARDHTGSGGTMRCAYVIKTSEV
ncbi:MAG: phage tail protein [Rhizobiales bacterium]|nr:phage tail protein [Hyphomicrobiales bacterium]